MTPDPIETPKCVVVGLGRAGSSFARALGERGCHVATIGGRSLVQSGPDGPAEEALRRADHVLVAVNDAAIPHVAGRLAEVESLSGVVAHVSGVCGLDVLEPLDAPASLHPLMSLPDTEIGSARLLDRCNFAVDGDERIIEIVTVLGGRAFRVAPEQRAVYHAAASVAANHLTALCAQVEALAAAADVPADAYWTLMSTTLSNITESGAAAALTGPAARGDWDTVGRHLAAIPAEERALYRCVSMSAAALAGRQWPDGL